MEDIANAAGLSRQSIYNQHGSKAAVLEWALAMFLSEIIDRSTTVLETPGADAIETLHAGFQAWTGDHIEMMRATPHGAELLETAMASAASSDRDYVSEFSDAVVRFLLSSGLVTKADEAADLNFVIQAVSKGLLLKSKTNEDYAKGMRRALKILFSR